MADLLIANSYLQLMLEHFEIPLPVQDLTISNICQRHDINESLFIAFTNLYCGSRSLPELNPDPKDILDIIAFLKSAHNFYSTEIYPEIMELISHMNRSNNSKEMKLVMLFYSDYFDEVNEHLDYENEVFHPYVHQLIEKMYGREIEVQSDFSAAHYRDNHSDIEEKLRDLKNLLIKYLPPQDDRAVRRKILFMLSELEFDLNIHSDIEELVLTPLVMRLESLVNEEQVK